MLFQVLYLFLKLLLVFHRHSNLRKFFGNLFTDVFNSIYNQQIDPKKARNVIVGIVGVIVLATVTIGGINYVKDNSLEQTVKIKKTEPKQEVKKKGSGNFPGRQVSPEYSQ